MDHNRGGDMTMTEYTGFAIRQLKRFARKYRVHLTVVAHPTKMQRIKDGKYPVPSLYDIADSAHWSNKPDVGIIIHRFRATQNSTLIRFAKVRFRAIGRPGDMAGHWNELSRRYQIGDPVQVLGDDYAKRG
jgi:twinkle protein